MFNSIFVLQNYIIPDHFPFVNRIHHSNYIRWFEEARDLYVRERGVDYGQIEAHGILMPVTDLRCEYKSAAKYWDLAAVTVRVLSFNGVRLRYGYEIRNAETGALIVTGETGHCFIDAKSRKPLNLKKNMPEYGELLSRMVGEEDGESK